MSLADTLCYLQRGLVKEVPLSALAGTRLGIDANHYLRRLLTPRDPTTSDAFLAAVGGAPLTLTAEVSSLLSSGYSGSGRGPS